MSREIYVQVAVWTRVKVSRESSTGDKEREAASSRIEALLTGHEGVEIEYLDRGGALKYRSHAEDRANAPAF